MPISIATVMSTVVKGREYYYHSILFCNLKKMNKLKKKWLDQWMNGYIGFILLSSRNIYKIIQIEIFIFKS